MKKITVLLFTVILCFLYSACSFDNEYPVTLAHTTIQRCPKHIICLSDSVADILMTCGYGDRIIARSEECTQPELSGLTSVGHKHSPSVNSIIDLHPDIVFADKSIPDEAYHTIRNSGIEILIMMPARTGDDLIRLYENIGAIMGGRYKGRETGSQKDCCHEPREGRQDRCGRNRAYGPKGRQEQGHCRSAQKPDRIQKTHEDSGRCSCCYAVRHHAGRS